MFKPMNTKDATTSLRKVLLYAHHGWGKTTQMKFYQQHYGKGFIISGESGLSSIRDAGIDYLPFTSWDGETNPEKGVYSFRAICALMKSEEFKAMGYKWIGLDSLTELGDLCFEHVDYEHRNNKNGFEKWGDYKQNMLGACKWIRDLPYHVVVTCLAKEENNDNGDVEYWPMVAGNSVQKQLPGIFDCVFCGVRHTQADPAKPAEPRIQRFIITEEVKGWHGKARDEGRRLRSVERTGNVCDLLHRLDMDEKEYAAYLKSQTKTEE